MELIPMCYQYAMLAPIASDLNEKNIGMAVTFEWLAFDLRYTLHICLKFGTLMWSPIKLMRFIRL